MPEGSTGILVGSARVAILPDMRGFITEAQAKIKSSLAGLKAEVPVKFTVDPGSVAAARAALGPLAAGRTVPLRFNVDPGSVARAQAALGPLATGRTVPLRFDVNTAGAAAKVAGITAAAGLAASASGELASKLGLAGAAEGAVGSQAAAAAPKLAAEAAAMRSAGLAAEAMTRKLAAARAEAAAVAAAAGGGDRGGGGGLLAGLGAAFGGGAAGRTLGFGRLGIPAGILGGVAAWHVALDGVLEAMLAIGLATAAAATGVAAMAESARNVYTHLQAVQAVSSSLGQHIAPLTGAFDKIAIAMAPQTLEVYGAGLDLVSRNAGVVGRTASQVVTIFDDWAAKIDLWAQAQGGFGAILHSGVGYLAQFGHILGTVGQTLGNLLHEDPGVAHYLLDIVGAAAKALQLFTELPAPIVSTVLALHGIYIWGRVLGGVLRTTGTGLAHMAVSLAGLAVNPLVWVGAAAAAIGYFTVQASRGTPAAQRFIAAVNQRIDSEQASRAITDISVAIGQLNDRIRATDTGAELRNMFSGGFGAQLSRMFTQNIPDWILGVGHAFAHLSDEVAHGGITGTLGALSGLFKAAFTNAAAGAEAARIDISKYNAEIDHLLGSQRNLLHETGVLMTGQTHFSAVTRTAAGQVTALGGSVQRTTRGGRSFAQALAIMDLAGVKASDSFALMQQKVQNLIRGYADAGVQAGLLGNSVNAVTFASLQQQSKITQLTQAWTQFFSTITGGETGFVSFAQGMQTLTKDLTPAAGSAAAAQSHLAVAQGRVASAQASLSALQRRGSATAGQLTAAHDRLRAAELNLTSVQSRYGSSARAAQVSITGLGAASLTARSQFLQTAQAAQAELGNLTILSSAAGMGARGTHLLSQATKDMIVQMLPAARHSRALTTVLYALAQQGGYHGADAFKALSEWVGKPRQPMQQLDRITTIFTVHAGNLGKDVKNLSIALGQTLTGAEKQAIFYADGGQRAFSNYAEALKHNGIENDVTRGKALKLATELIRVTGNTKDAHNEFDAMTIGMGFTRREADKLWASIVKTAKAEDGLHNKHIAITETGTGSFSISQGAPLTPAGQRARQRSLINRAQGGLIPGFGGGDIVPLLAEPGEAVVDKYRTRKYAPVLKAMGVPGFTTGGYVGDVAGLAPFTRKFDTAMTTAMTTAMISAMKAAQKAAIAAAFSSLHGIPGGSGVSRWTGLVREALAMEHLSPYLTGNVLYQMQTESGGNARAINLTDINAQQGDPSRGLMQVIGSTFRAYHWPGTSWNIYDPLANIAAALNYARHRYGPTLERGGMGIGSGHGYDEGGWLPPGLSLAANMTGKPELVLNASQLRRLDNGGGTTYIANFPDEWAASAMESRVRQAYTAMEINAGRRARIGRNS